MSEPTEYDYRHKVPIRRWADADLLDVRVEATHHVVPASDGKGMNLDVLVRPGEGDVLIVVLHGALVREKYSPPRFEWFGTLRPRPEHLLFVADPGLELAPDLAISWYTGTEEDDVMARVAELACTVAEQLGAAEILLVGGSGGGYASLMVSAQLPGSMALAFSPQITIAEYYPRFVRRYREVVLPQFGDMTAARAALPGRLSALDVYTDLDSMANHFTIVQNTGDRFHIDRHLMPLLGQLGLPLESASHRDGSATIELEYFSDGHGMPYKDILLDYLDESLASSRRHHTSIDG